MRKKWIVLALGAALVGSGVAASLYSGTNAFAAGANSNGAASPAPQSLVQQKEEAEKSTPQQEANEAASLVKEVTVSQDQAVRSALAKVPGTVVKSQLDDENGLVVYSIEVKKQDGTSVDVKVDGKTGQVVKTESDDGNEKGVEKGEGQEGTETGTADHDQVQHEEQGEHQGDNGQ